MFGDDYQRMPVQNNSAINDYSEIPGQTAEYRSNKMTKVQSYSYSGSWLYYALRVYIVGGSMELPLK